MTPTISPVGKLKVVKAKSAEGRFPEGVTIAADVVFEDEEGNEWSVTMESNRGELTLHSQAPRLKSACYRHWPIHRTGCEYCERIDNEEKKE